MGEKKRKWKSANRGSVRRESKWRENREIIEGKEKV